MTPETRAKREIRLAASDLGCVLWSNAGGVANLRNGRKLRYGLGVGSADLIGIAPDGRFLAVEMKSATGKATPEQRQFLALVARRGGVAILCRTAMGLRAALTFAGPVRNSVFSERSRSSAFIEVTPWGEYGREIIR